MRKSYFFRNIQDYEELLMKTKQARERTSGNCREYVVVRKIILSKDEFYKIEHDIMNCHDIVIRHNEVMRVRAGIWECIQLCSEEKSIIVMADGYPYPRFVALDEFENT